MTSVTDFNFHLVFVTLCQRLEMAHCHIKKNVFILTNNKDSRLGKLHPSLFYLNVKTKTTSKRSG